jgi:outer membrane protein OmpA-like peptidoglycan-associated protein
MKLRLVLCVGVFSGLAACATGPGSGLQEDAGCPPVAYSVYFARDQVALDDLAGEILDTTAAALTGCAGGRLEVAGYADPAGDAEINRRVSEQRADAVLRGLLERGVTAGQVRTLAFGEDGARSEEGLTEPMRRRVDVFFIPAGM